jgi:hypothetical protein
VVTRPKFEGCNSPQRGIKPFIERVNGKHFVVVPYTLRNKGIRLRELCSLGSHKRPISYCTPALA